MKLNLMRRCCRCLFTRRSIVFLDSHPKLKLIAIRSSGYDHVDVGECEKRNVAVCFTPGCSDQTVSEHAFALILALARRTGEVLDACKRRRFSYVGDARIRC